MKTLGIIGGLGPESTIDYYRSIIALYREKTGGEGYPPLVIVSLDVDKGLRLLGANQLQEMAEYLASGARQLAAAGADFALLSANSGHIVFDELRQASPIPLISIVEATCVEVSRQQLRTVGLLGTRFTMAGRFYFDVAKKYGLRLIAPTAEEQAWIHDKYVNELLRGTFLPETREGLIQIIAAMKQRDGIEGIVLAGTELPLILRAESIAGLALLDTTQIHVRAAVEEMLGNEEAEHNA
ncbi:MAG: amino acid racemase [Candidatus Korobacteraceae bacterium]